MKNAIQVGGVDGAALIRVNRGGKGFQVSLANLCRKFHGGQDRGRTWDRATPTRIRSLCGTTFHLNLIADVVATGHVSVVKLLLRSGKSVRLSSDQSVCVDFDRFQRVGNLKPGDTVLTNGTWLDKDGYVRAGGYKGKHSRCTTGGVYEHILVAERMLGRPLAPDERVHHRNRIRHDNRPENLEVLTNSEHASRHGRDGGFSRLHGGRGRACFVPEFDAVLSAKEDGESHVYSVALAGSHGNFVANGLIVQACVGNQLVPVTDGAETETIKAPPLQLAV